MRPPPYSSPETAEVEIRFAAHSDEVSTSVDKRATVDEDGNLDEMGVFCLARGKQEKNDGAPDISWFDPEDNYASCLMKNVKAKKEGSNVTWEEHYFYPSANSTCMSSTATIRMQRMPISRMKRRQTETAPAARVIAPQCIIR